MRRSLPVLSLCVSALAATPALAQVEGYPVLDNESIGLVRALDEAVAGAPEQFDERQWALETINSIVSGGEVMSPFRYLIAFSAYSVGQAAVYTPAWREPYRQTYQGFLDKMAQPVAWQDFLTVWNGESPLGPDNVMYTGHLVLMMTQYQQLFGDDRYEQPLVLTASDGRTFETDVHALSASIAQQTATNTDNDGLQHFNVPCEPGHVFVPCNTPHRVSDLIYDRAWGTEYAATAGAWVEWVQQRMVHEDSGVLYHLWWPFGAGQLDPSQGKPPVRNERLSGVYNAWTIWFLRGIAPEWGAALYQRFVEHFVVRGAESPYPDGRTMVIDVFGQDGLAAALMDLVATGFGIVTAKTFDDEPLAVELQQSWDAYFGRPEWSADGTTLSYEGAILPLVFQNSFPLLGRTATPERNIAVDALGSWDAGRFDAPYVASISNDAAFVNQAVWDAELEQLVVTLNGGWATSEPASIAVANLDPDVVWTVTRNGRAFESVDQDGDRLVIETPGLGPSMESYIVAAAPPAVEETGCGCGGDGVVGASAVGLPLLLMGRGFGRRRR